MGFIDNLKKYFKTNIEEISEPNPIGSIEFLWINTNTHTVSQGYYIGAQLNDNFLSFIFVIPENNSCQIIKSYEINKNFINSTNSIQNINDSWFEFSESKDKDFIKVCPKFTKSYEIFTDRFVLKCDKFTKLLEITIPNCIINSINE